MQRRALFVLALLGVAPPAWSGCVNNPVHDDQVAALGPEAANVPAGATHRPGQPCLVCHGPFGPAQVQFAFGGTVYLEAGQSAPAPAAVVGVEDVSGSKVAAPANEVGNFYVLLRDYNPKYPLKTTVTSADGAIVQTMQTYVARNGSCASCHESAASATSPGPVVVSPGADAAGGG
jgi:cytochrome c553